MPLNDNKTLADCSISEDQTITLVILPGPKNIEPMINELKKIRKKYDKYELIEERKTVHEFLKNYDIQKN